MVSHETWTTFVRQGVAITLDARPRVRAGRTIPIAVTMKGGRLGGSSLSVGPVQIRRRINYAQGGFGEGTSSSSVSMVGSSGTSWSHPAPSAVPGPAEFPIELQLALLDEGAGGESTVGTWTQTFDVKVDIVPNDVSTLTPMRSSDMKARMAAALRGSEVHLVTDFQPSWLEVRVHAASSPAPLAARVFVRPAGQPEAPEFEVGTLFHRPDTNWWHYVSKEWPSGAQVPERVDVIFRPDAEPAEESVTATEYLDEEIVLEGVAVHSPSTNPAITPAK
jgi:hypothetical protein